MSTLELIQQYPKQVSAETAQGVVNQLVDTYPSKDLVDALFEEYDSLSSHQKAILLEALACYSDLDPGEDLRLLVVISLGLHDESTFVQAMARALEEGPDA